VPALENGALVYVMHIVKGNNYAIITVSGDTALIDKDLFRAIDF